MIKISIYTQCKECRTIGTRKIDTDLQREPCKVCGGELKQISSTDFDKLVHFDSTVMFEHDSFNKDFHPERHANNSETPISPKAKTGQTTWSFENGSAHFR